MSEFVKGVLVGAVGLALVEVVAIFLAYKVVYRLRITG